MQGAIQVLGFTFTFYDTVFSSSSSSSYLLFICSEHIMQHLQQRLGVPEIQVFQIEF